MSEDLRCCGSGTCIINKEGQCWCGQQWDGQKMCHQPIASPLKSTKCAAGLGANASSALSNPSTDSPTGVQ